MLARLFTSGQDALKLMEESKDKDVSKVNQGQVNDWVVLAVNIVTEPLDQHEKIKVLAAAINEAKNIGQAP